jgi:hypothetical protein
MKKKNNPIKAMERANVRASVLKTRSEMLLDRAYSDLVKAAKANGITVEELIKKRNDAARKKELSGKK